MPEDAKALALRMYELFESDDIDAFDGLVAEDVVDHNPFPGQPDGLEGVKFLTRMIRSAFPDFHQDIKDVIAEGDRVAVHSTMTGTQRGEFMGVPATGRRIEVDSIDIFRFDSGKAVEHWGLFDQMTFMAQLGMMPEPPADGEG